MPTLIDELIVRLGLDSKGLANAPDAKKKLEDLDKGAESVEKSTKGAAAGLSEVTGKLGAFLALIGGTVVLKNFVRDAIATNTQLSFLSRNLGMTAQDISAWGTVAEEFGGSAQGIQGTLGRLSMEATNFALRGQSSLIPFLSMMRVGFDQLHPEKVLLGMAQWAQNAIASGSSRPAVHNILEQMGIDGGTINAMLQGATALKSYLAAVKQFGPTDKEARDAAQMNQQLVLMEMQFRKIGIDLLDQATPYLEKFIELLQRFGAWVQEHEEIAAVFAAVGFALGGVSAVAGALVIVLPGLEAGFALLTGPIGLVATAVGLLSVGFVSLLSDYEKWKSGAASNFDWTAFSSDIRNAADNFSYLGDMIEKATDRFSKWLASHGVHLADIWQETLADLELMGGKVNWIPIAPTPEIKSLANRIATREGYFHQGGPLNIPQRGNNPGSIEIGPFARAHGATGSITGEGGHQIAVFPDAETGWKALYAELQARGTSPWSYMPKIPPFALSGEPGASPLSLLEVMRNIPPPGWLTRLAPPALPAPIIRSTSRTWIFTRRRRMRRESRHR